MHNSVDDLLCLNRFGITGIEQRLKVQIHVLWSPPSYGWYKVNTDGVSMGNSGLAAAGSVFRDHDASVLTCFSSLLGSFSDFEAELLVVCIAVEKVRQLHIPNLWIECDSLLGTRCYRGSTFRFLRGFRFLAALFEIFRRFELPSFSYLQCYAAEQVVLLPLSGQYY